MRQQVLPLWTAFERGYMRAAARCTGIRLLAVQDDGEYETGTGEALNPFSLPGLLPLGRLALTRSGCWQCKVPMRPAQVGSSLPGYAVVPPQGPPAAGGATDWPLKGTSALPSRVVLLN